MHQKIFYQQVIYFLDICHVRMYSLAVVLSSILKLDQATGIYN